jgi:thiopeptide-type bacteriocin biosynthesis protein
MDKIPAPAAARTAAPAPVPGGGLYEPLEWMLVRAPLLPVEAYLGLHQSLQRAAGQQAGAGIAGVLGSFPAGPRIATALAVGSPSLFDALERSGLGGKDGERCAAKLLRYLIRMSTRPTPYGLFAGVGMARWGPETTLRIGPGHPRTRTRPDMAWLLGLVFELDSRPDVRAQLSYLANPRAFIRVGRVFLPAPAPAAGGGGMGPTVSVRATRVVTRALDLARNPIPHERLVAELAAMPGATRGKAETLIQELWRQTLLLTDLRPPLTGTPPAEYVAGRLEKIAAAAQARDRLAGALTAMAAWDDRPWDGAAAGYRALIRLSGADDKPAAAPPQVDMALPLAGDQVCRAVAGEAARAAEMLLRLSPLPAGLPHLAAYRGAFAARYGHDREVPLLEMLDPDFGLGPLSAHSHGGPAVMDPRKAAQRSQALQHLALAALRERCLVAELDEDALSRLETCSPSPLSVPASLDLSLFVVARSAADLDAGRFQVVIGPNLGATAAGRNLGRFADLLGEPARAGLDDIAHAESARYPDRLHAELVYLPGHSRSANVAVRPHPRQYEIALGTTPGVSPDRVIPPDELLVGIRDDRFYVRWPARDAEIVGCAGHMLSNMAAPDVCRFLDELRHDGLAQLSGFDWGSAASFPVLPRVQAGRVVLSLARWRLDARAGQQLTPDSPGGFAARLAAWREQWDVPRHVYLRFADNRLLLDLEDQAQASELRTELRTLKDGGQILLEEALPGPGDAWLPGPDGRYVTEIVVPLVLRPPQAMSPAAVPRQVSSLSLHDRVRAPGSDWLFAKLYCPQSMQDDLLAGPVPELCEQALASGTAADWFFIRYADPDPHLRLRFRGDPEQLIGKLAPELCARADALISEGMCTRLCLDTYVRELERYGGPAGTSVAEALFGADSRFTVEALRLHRSGLLGIDMTALAVLSIDSLLAGLGAGPAQRLAWYRARIPSKSTSGQEYRQRQAALRALLGDPGHLLRQPGGDALARALAAREHELSQPARQLSDLIGTGQIPQPASELYRSYVHLHCNRLLGPGGPAEDQIIGLLQRARYSLSQAPLTPPENE